MLLGLRLQPMVRQEQKLELLTALTCSVCKRQIDTAKKIEDEVVAALVGYKKYAVCSCCGRNVDIENPLFNNRGYRVRWTRWAHKRDKEKGLTIRVRASKARLKTPF